MLTAFFIRAKHWQVFLFFEALFFVDLMLQTLFLSSLVYLLSIVVLVWYFRSVMHPDLKPRVGLFCAGVVYVAGLTVAINWWPFPSLELLIYLVVVASFFSFYNLYYVAKCLLIAETTRPFGLSEALQDLPFFWAPTFRGFRGALYSLALPMIGIWFLQPRINALYEDALAGEFNWQTPN